MDDFTARETLTGPANGTRYFCPWPRCDWFVDVDPGQTEPGYKRDGSWVLLTSATATREQVDHYLRSHLDTSHPGWTVEDLNRHSVAYRLHGLM